ncbi:MarR family transcriptional regulator [Desulforhopalus vacuolatus]|uniref:MarR family winged helix-turn-helix transcriptional regulator n=1 Tax=Desulforhopalus vacuolatus TaxID=40414 RepID=UPI001965A8BB|nr:MarR family transcriptional regulator [Desulforhopalus vacuolatus]MBM9520310.1 MarR family transcriptional regulator [Desulforhopalus vacuolatus]
MNDRLRSSLGEKGIHFGQARILTALLKHHSLSQREIAIGLHIKPATVTNMVKKMEASGLIARNRDDNDDRIINVTLTPEGEEAAHFAEEIIQKIESEIRSGFNAEELEHLRVPLENVRNTLGGTDPSL